MAKSKMLLLSVFLNPKNKASVTLTSHDVAVLAQRRAGWRGSNRLKEFRRESKHSEGSKEFRRPLTLSEFDKTCMCSTVFPLHKLVSTLRPSEFPIFEKLQKAFLAAKIGNKCQILGLPFQNVKSFGLDCQQNLGSIQLS